MLLTRRSLCRFLHVGTEEPAYLEGVIERDKHLLISPDIFAARRIAELRGGKSEVMLTNFSNEYKHVHKGTTVAFTEKIVEASHAFTLNDFREPTLATQVPAPAFVVNPRVPSQRQEQINILLRK